MTGVAFVTVCCDTVPAHAALQGGKELGLGVSRMRAVVYGEVAKVTERSYTSQGQRKTVFDAYVGEAPYYDKITGPMELAPKVGDRVEFVANIRVKSGTSSKTGNAYAFLDVWVIEDARISQKPVAVA